MSYAKVVALLSSGSSVDDVLAGAVLEQLEWMIGTRINVQRCRSRNMRRLLVGAA